ncbi:MAG: hypothetical protein QXR60_02855 [Candidatus Nanoarchaeia archaeon]
MEKYTQQIAIGLVTVLLILLIVLSLGYVDVSMNVLYSLFLCILFILSLIFTPKFFEKKPKKRKKTKR